MQHNNAVKRTLGDDEFLEPGELLDEVFDLDTVPLGQHQRGHNAGRHRHDIGCGRTIKRYKRPLALHGSNRASTEV